MEINQAVKVILDSINITQREAIPCLFALKYGYIASYFPQSLIQKLNASGIYSVVEKSGKNVIHFDVPLFETEVGEWDWVVNEYIPILVSKSVRKTPYKRQTSKLMKNLFIRRAGEISKEDVIEATKMYASSTNPTYIRSPHYFIQKGSGETMTRDLENWIEIYQDSKEVADTVSVTNTIQ